MSEVICRSSQLPYSAHDEDIIRLLAMPVTDQIVQHVATKLTAALDTLKGQQHLPTPPTTPVRGKFAPTCTPELDFPSLQQFIAKLVFHSGIHTASVLGSLIYLKRVTRALQSDSIEHGPEMPYRLAVALFVISGKYHHDGSYATIFWAICVSAALGIDKTANEKAYEAYEKRRRTPRHKKSQTTEEPNEPVPADPKLGHMFGAEAITALERDLLHLLDYNLRFTEDELRDTLNGLSSHPRAVGPLETLQMASGIPSANFLKKNPKLYATSMRRSVSPLDLARSQSQQGPLTPRSPPNRLVKSGTKKSKFGTTESVDSWSHVPYPQLTLDMDTRCLSKLLTASKSRSPFAPLGVPPVPPSTPTAGIYSLPCICGGKTQPLTPEATEPTPPELVAPAEGSLRKRGQAGRIVYEPMGPQTKQVVAPAPRRGPNLLDTPPPLSAFGSGTLYMLAPRRSLVEPRLVSVAYAQSYTLGQRRAARSRSAIKENVERWTRARKDRVDGLSAGGQTSPDHHPFQSHSSDLSKSEPEPEPEPAAQHFRGVVESGPVGLLNTRWDKLPARGGDETSDESQTAAPLKIVDKRPTQCEVSTSEKPNNGLLGTCYVRAPPCEEHSGPVRRSSFKVAWLERLIGKKLDYHSGHLSGQ